ncbi:MAG: acyl-CoA dehydrogenase family protein [Actinomycetota bacterium]|nr:acyl-CoA dehydrogenase family protein [Actinomycetota bacterium]
MTTSVLERVTALTPAVPKRAEEIEQARRLPLDLLDELTQAGCFRMGLPRSHGGEELGFSDIIGVIELLSRADGAVGWTVMIGGTTPELFAFLPQARFDALYASGPDLIGGGTVAPKGLAVAVDGGYRASGRWAFASGSEHCSWLMAHCVVLGADGKLQLGPKGLPVMRAMVLPAQEFQIVDTWHVSGLRGTGSHDLVLEEAFVPSDQAMDIFGEANLPGPLFRIPLLDKFGLYVASVGVGIAAGALEEVQALAVGGKRPAFAPQRIAENPLFQHRLGEADANLRAARALLYAEADAAWAAAVEGRALSPLERAQLRATGSHVTALATSVVDTAYNLGGGTSVYNSCPLQRRLRDIHTLTQHAVVAPASYATVGAGLAGEDLSAMLI